MKCALLVDYSNLYTVLAASPGTSEHPDEIIVQLIDELRRHVSDHLNMQPLRTMLFANLSSTPSVGLRDMEEWVNRGIEPRFTSSANGTGSCLQIMTIEACRQLFSGLPMESLVILSGNVWYSDLVQEYQRNGRFVLAACLETPEAGAGLPESVSDSYFNAGYLVNRLQAPDSGAAGTTLPFRDPDLQTQDRPEKTLPIEDSIARRGLEIIESEFGQYEEVYLTPLLRRLTEQLDGEDEPKSVINTLEECGAVWLEKRRGFPHNYTVLMMNNEHPEVSDLKKTFQAERDDDYYENSDDEFGGTYESDEAVFEGVDD